MLIELLPSDTVNRMGIAEGDKFELMEREGGLFLIPVVEYPQDTLDELARIIEEHDKEPSVVYKTVDDLMKAMGIDIEAYDDV